MKNHILSLFSTFICFILISCNKNAQIKTPVFEIKTDFISKDSNFKKIIELEHSLSQQIENILIAKNITRNRLNYIFDSLKSNSKSVLDLNLKINEQISPGLYESLTIFEINYRKNWSYLTKRYISISSVEINTATKKYYQTIESNKIYLASKRRFSINNNYIAKACGWSYGLCLAGATAGAILCHSSCIGATAGFGAPACVLLCGTIQVAVGEECFRNYCAEK